MVKTFNEGLLCLCQLVGMFRIDGWEIARTHLIFIAINDDSTLLIVYHIKKTSIIHLPKWMLLDQLRLQFKLENADGFVHLSHQSHVSFIEWIVLRNLWFELDTRVFSIDVHRKGG